MKLKSVATAGFLAALVALPTPAWALFCSNSGPTAGYKTVYENGERRHVPDDEAQAELDLRRLREIGVAATSVERWNGCLRAFVRREDGDQAMEFYDPASLQRLQ